MRDVFFVRCGPQPYFDFNKGYTEVRGSAISAHVNRDTHWMYSQFIQIKRHVQTLIDHWPMSNRLLGRDQDSQSQRLC